MHGTDEMLSSNARLDRQVRSDPPEDVFFFYPCSVLLVCSWDRREDGRCTVMASRHGVVDPTQACNTATVVSGPEAQGFWNCSCGRGWMTVFIQFHSALTLEELLQVGGRE